MSALITGLQSRLEDKLRLVQYQPWYLYLGGLTRRTWISVVLCSVILTLVITLLILTNTTLQSKASCKIVGGDDLCVFPFSYKGALYSGCTTVDNNGTEWCSTKTDHRGVHTKGSWGNCGEGCSSGCRTVSGPVTGALCVFPYTWQGKVYRECTTAHNNGVMWCATQTDWQGHYVDEKWGNCGSSCTGCGTSEGESCVFPFTYQGDKYTECTTEDNNGTLWCALSTDTSGEWRKDHHRWGNCGDGCTVGCHTYSGVPCVFPFQYNGTVHRHCSKEEGNKLTWCATEVEEGGQMAEGKWEYCAGAVLRHRNKGT